MNAAGLVNLIAAGGATERFHTVDTLKVNTVGHHSFGVGWFCYILSDGKPSAVLLLHALAHDLAEHEVGDMPAPTKLLIGGGMQSAEDEVLRTAGLHLPPLDASEAAVLKLADCLDGFMFCMLELRRGNLGIAPAASNFYRYVSLRLPPQGLAHDTFNAVKALSRRDFQSWYIRKEVAENV